MHNARDLLIRLSLDILGVPHRYVTGYRSGQTARLALQRNEVNFYAEPASAYRGAVEAQVDPARHRDSGLCRPDLQRREP